MKHNKTILLFLRLRELRLGTAFALALIPLALLLGTDLAWAAPSQIVSFDVETRGSDVEANLVFSGETRKYKVFQSDKRISVRFRGTQLMGSSGKVDDLPAPFTRGYLSQLGKDVVLTLYSDMPAKKLMQGLTTQEADGVVTLAFKGVVTPTAVPAVTQNVPTALPNANGKLNSLDDLLASLKVNQATAEMRQPGLIEKEEANPVAVDDSQEEPAPERGSDALLASLMKEKGLDGTPAERKEEGTKKEWSSMRWIGTMLVLGLLTFAAWYLKKMRSPLAGFDKSEVKVLANKQISMKSRLVLVEVDGERLLFSVGDGGMKLAHKFDEKDSVENGDVFESAAQEFRAKEAAPKAAALPAPTATSTPAPRSVKAQPPALPTLAEPKDFKEKAQALSIALAKRKAEKVTEPNRPVPTLAAVPAPTPAPAVERPRAEQTLSKRERDEKRKGSVQEFLSQFSNKVEASAPVSGVKANSRFGRAVANTMNFMSGN